MRSASVGCVGPAWRAGPGGAVLWRQVMMRRGLWLLLGVLLAGLGGCAVPQDQNVPRDAVRLVDPLSRRDYYLYVSSKVRPNVPAPVIVSLHGTVPWDTASRQVGEWKKIAEDAGAILICPKLVSSDGILPRSDASRLDRLVRDERMVLSILAQLGRRFELDRRNVFLTGWSGGGFGVYFIGLRHPELFTALCVRQGTFNQDTLEGRLAPAARWMPVLIFYGSFDFVPVQNQSRDAHAFLQQQGFTNVTLTTVGGGHVRHPEVAMEFFRKHWDRGPIGYSGAN